MGSCVTPNARNNTQNNRLQTLLQKIRISLDHQLGKRNKMLQQQQFNLYHSLLKQKYGRSLSVQKAMIGRTVYYKNINQIYFICFNQCKSILDRKDAIEKNIEVVQSSMQTLIYCASILKQQGLFELQQIMRKYQDFKFPTDSDIRYDLVKIHKKTDQVTFQMENSYMLEFCGIHSLDMTKVNEVGHSYGYAASRHTVMK